VKVPVLSGKKVLFLDDQLTSIELHKDVLVEEHCCQVDLADSIEDFLKIVHSRKVFEFSLICIDMMMKYKADPSLADANGAFCLNTLRREEKKCDRIPMIPVLIFSRFDIDYAIRQCAIQYYCFRDDIPTLLSMSGDPKALASKLADWKVHFLSKKDRFGAPDLFPSWIAKLL
jgi:CheY-like chemotaxis protein